MRLVRERLIALVATAASWAVLCASPPETNDTTEEFLVTTSEVGRYGGRLVLAQRAEPTTFNPVIAVDAASRSAIELVMADLIHINRHSQQTEAALAKTWTVSPDGRHYTLRLRRGLRFSDGHPVDAEDVLFTFRVYLDEKIHSPQRDLLIIGGKPLTVQKIDSRTVRFELAQPYAAAERLFDNIAILPSHLLQSAYQEGKLIDAWGLNTQPQAVAGLGPFRLKEYIPGQRTTLERNPYYWKKDRQGNRLPYLDEIVFLFTASEDAQAIRFQAGESDISSRLSAENFSVLEKYQQLRGFRLHDLGPGLEYDFLLFNLNDISGKGFPPISRSQAWFRRVAFRQAVSAAIDREGIVRLVYRGRATPLWTQVTPGNKLWVNRAIPQMPRSVARARQLLQDAGFSWKSDGTLIDDQGERVTFSIVTSASNSQRIQMATIIQDDLKQLGIDVQLVSLEFRTMLDRIFKTHEYEAAVMALAGGDADPNSEMNVWVSRGGTHIWNLWPSQILTSWEAEIDRLMQQQLITLKYQERKRLYDRVQQLVAENLPIICLVSPNILVGAKERLGNFRPAILSDYTLWNAEELFFRQEAQPTRR
jgi:peptide/nickel transport system substrate-binding protein